MRNGILVAAVVAVALTYAIAQQQGSAPPANPPAAQSGSQQQSSDTPPTDVASPDDAAGKANPNAPDARPNQQDQAPDQSAGDQQKAADKPSRGQRAKDHLKKQMSSWCVGAPLNHCYEKKTSDDSAGSDREPQNPRPPRSDDTATAPPVSKGESSSKDTKIDLTPPTGDEADHPNSEPEVEAGEFHPWDPHRAMKNIEVGDFYYKQQNYRAAVSRYEEALQWKPRDAEATFKLADAQDKMGNFVAARKYYEDYLKILPEGPHAEQVNKALARLK